MKFSEGKVKAYVDKFIHKHTRERLSRCQIKRKDATRSTGRKLYRMVYRSTCCMQDLLGLVYEYPPLSIDQHAPDVGSDDLSEDVTKCFETREAFEDDHG